MDTYSNIPVSGFPYNSIGLMQSKDHAALSVTCTCVIEDELKPFFVDF